WNALIVVLRADHARARHRRPTAARHDCLKMLDGALHGVDHDVAAPGGGVGAQIIERLGSPARILIRGATRLAFRLAKTGNAFPPGSVAPLRRRSPHREGEG